MSTGLKTWSRFLLAALRPVSALRSHPAVASDQANKVFRIDGQPTARVRTPLGRGTPENRKAPPDGIATRRNQFSKSGLAVLRVPFRVVPKVEREMEFDG